MEPSTKISLSIVLSAVLLLVGQVGYGEYLRHQLFGLSAVGQALDELGLSDPGSNPRRSEYVKTVRVPTFAPSVPPPADHVLSSRQRCVGGTVVDVSNGAYVQRLQSGHPVRCSGRLAAEPLR